MRATKRLQKLASLFIYIRNADRRVCHALRNKLLNYNRFDCEMTTVDNDCNLMISSDASNILECPICMDRLTVPVTSMCSNGHAVCNACKIKVVTCPCCRTPLLKTRNTLLDRVIEMTTFPCRNKVFGCDIKKKYKEVSYHEEKDCDYKPIPCCLLNDEIEKCGKAVVLKNFFSHILKEHANLLEKIQVNQDTVRKICSTNHEFFQVQNILQDSEKDLIFIETCFYDKQQDTFFLCYQYVGNVVDSKNYVCTSTFYDPSDNLKKLKYVNVCLPIGMSIKCMKEDPRCLVIHPNKIISKKEGIMEVNHVIKIEELNTYNSRKSKRVKLCNS